VKALADTPLVGETIQLKGNMMGFYIFIGAMVVAFLVVIFKTYVELMKGGAGLDPEDYQQHDKDSYP
jgi:hypothetical protein